VTEGPTGGPAPAATPGPAPVVRFVRLPEVPLADVVALLGEPRNLRHLPLAGGRPTPESAAAWVRSKDAQWEAAGYGPWAVLLDDVFAGWGGFEPEEGGPDFALVLLPRFWGSGQLVLQAALTVGFGELGFDRVTIALPHSRNPDRAVASLGFVPDGEVVHGGVPFRRYALDRDAWRAVAGDGHA
jgi:RimJ/RimL family protein N-acetyltransferase